MLRFPNITVFSNYVWENFEFVTSPTYEHLGGMSFESENSRVELELTDHYLTDHIHLSLSVFHCDRWIDVLGPEDFIYIKGEVHEDMYALIVDIVEQLSNWQDTFLIAGDEVHTFFKSIPGRSELCKLADQLGALRLEINHASFFSLHFDGFRLDLFGDSYPDVIEPLTPWTQDAKGYRDRMSMYRKIAEVLELYERITGNLIGD